MKGDFSRDTFDRQHRFARVLMQQGRVLLDADWNEQAAILLHYLRALAADLIGPHGGPGDGFKISCEDEDGAGLQCDFWIGWGHYYVDGILCENHPPRLCPLDEKAVSAPEKVTYNNQPDYPLREKDEAKLEEDSTYLVYLDVWERHLTHLEADSIREVALGGPDTATRTKIVWQVKVATDKNTAEEETCGDLFDRLVRRPLVDNHRRCLRARAHVKTPIDDCCAIPPEARYRGLENQLYRVEIHDDCPARQAGKPRATFKWSRDNGSVEFGIRSLQGSTAALESLGPDGWHSLKEGDWVEIVDDFSVLRGEAGPLARVEAVDRVGFKVTLAHKKDLPDFDEGSATHPLLRRWDQGSDALPVEEGEWIDLEDGVQVWFEPGGAYRTGDYWQIPARTATGGVHWPSEQGPDGTPQAQALQPHGIEHHYAPLARIRVGDGGLVTCDDDCRCRLISLCELERPTVGGFFSAESIGAPESAPSDAHLSLLGVEGVGAAFASRLEATGIRDAAELARLEPAELAEILTAPGGRSVAQARAASIIENAKRSVSG